MAAAKIEDGPLLRRVSRSGKVQGDSLSDWAIWSVVEQSAKEIGVERFGAHDLAPNLRDVVSPVITYY